MLPGRALAAPAVEELGRILGPIGHDFDPVLLRTCSAMRDRRRDRGVRELVLLGAGMDRRAFRLALPAEATVFELDQASSLAYKRRVLEALGARAVCKRVTRRRPRRRLAGAARAGGPRAVRPNDVGARGQVALTGCGRLPQTRSACRNTSQRLHSHADRATMAV